jgi:hypothetical protein
MTDPLRKPEGLSWNAASVELPEIPTLPAGQDALSATISAVLPTLAAPLTANVATLQAKETMFAGKLGAAQAAYQNSDDAGSQSVGQVVGMLGQLGQQAGQMGQMSGAPAQAVGGQTGMFGSLMQQAMQAAQGGAGAASSPVGAAPPTPLRDNAVNAKSEQAPQHHQPPREQREPLQRAETTEGASDDGKHGHAPVKSPEHQQHRGDQDLGRRM